MITRTSDAGGGVTSTTSESPLSPEVEGVSAGVASGAGVSPVLVAEAAAGPPVGELSLMLPLLCVCFREVCETAI